MPTRAAAANAAENARRTMFAPMWDDEAMSCKVVESGVQLSKVDYHFSIPNGPPRKRKQVEGE